MGSRFVFQEPQKAASDSLAPVFDVDGHAADSGRGVFVAVEHSAGGHHLSSVKDYGVGGDGVDLVQFLFHGHLLLAHEHPESHAQRALHLRLSFD